MVSSEESDGSESLGVPEEGNEMLTFDFHVLIFLGWGESKSENVHRAGLFFRSDLNGGRFGARRMIF